MDQERRKQSRISELEEWLRERINLRGEKLRSRAREMYEYEEFEKEYESYGQDWSPARGVCDPFEDDDNNNYSLGGAGPR